ncbi:hypothetical protein BOTBODRAFT_37551 [Botryobasidium botryosum FD-172 SS1]|uniref:Pentacotripeptide-repeat region of PRORP domain-containing protein n=1 Tax=Botryobasidium botryosum (strain FD-172 SS1) TaxID=930990 RepID=A0A067M2E6_BOTB1|nr:hypothetical protein BOTBODRAFT_37551 [Botryobasidium botryosum FD-172 SS1]
MTELSPSLSAHATGLILCALLGTRTTGHCTSSRSLVRTITRSAHANAAPELASLSPGRPFPQPSKSSSARRAYGSSSSIHPRPSTSATPSAFPRDSGLVGSLGIPLRQKPNLSHPPSRHFSSATARVESTPSPSTVLPTSSTPPEASDTPQRIALELFVKEIRAAHPKLADVVTLLRDLIATDGLRLLLDVQLIEVDALLRGTQPPSGDVKQDVANAQEQARCLRDILTETRRRDDAWDSNRLDEYGARSPFYRLSRLHSLLLMGELEKAERYLDHWQMLDRTAYGTTDTLAIICQLISAYRREGFPAPAFRLILQEWDAIHPYFYYYGNDGKARQAFQAERVIGARIRKEVFVMAESIREPSRWLSGNRHEWTDEEAQTVASIMTAAYCKRRYFVDAYSTYKHMQRSKMKINPRLTMLLIDSLIAAGDLHAATALYDDLGTADSIAREPGYIGLGLRLFAHAGDVPRAQQALEELEQMDERQFTHRTWLMQAHSEAGNVEEVVRLFREYFPKVDGAYTLKVRPSVRHYAVVIEAHTRRGDIDGANRWIQEMAKEGISPNVVIFTIILDYFAKRGDATSALAILRQIERADVSPSAVTYTTLIKLFARRHDPVNAELMAKRALRDGIPLDRIMLTTLMNAHVESSSWKGVIRVFDYVSASDMRRMGLPLPIYNTLLKAYVLIGAPFSTIAKFFLQLEERGLAPDEYTYALAIQSACDAGQMDSARDLLREFDQLAERKDNDMEMNVYVLTIMMAGYLRLGDKVKAKGVYDDMKARGIQPNSVTYSVILRAYANEGSEESLRLADEFLASILSTAGTTGFNSPSESVETSRELLFAPLLSANVRNLRPEEVERRIDELLALGNEVTIPSLSMLMDSYRRIGNIRAVKKVWEQIFAIAIKTSKEAIIDEDQKRDATNSSWVNILCLPLSIYIDALSGHSLHLEIAREWAAVKKAGFGFDAHNWNHLVLALVRAGEVERGFEVLEKVILPYQAQSEALVHDRTAEPSTPFVFDDIPQADPELEGTSQVVNPPTRPPSRRGQSIELIAEKMPHAQGEKDDLALPLHYLHQLLPSWNLWRPHERTLRTLDDALQRLSRGLHVRATVPIGQPAPEDSNDEDQAKQPFAILARIHERYPRAVRAVQEYHGERFRT